MDFGFEDHPEIEMVMQHGPPPPPPLSPPPEGAPPPPPENAFRTFLNQNVRPFFTVPPNQSSPDIGTIIFAGVVTAGNFLYATAVIMFTQIYGSVHAAINWLLHSPEVHVADIEHGDIVPPNFLSQQWVDQNVLSLTENGRRFPEVPLVFSLLYCIVFGVLTLHSILLVYNCPRVKFKKCGASWSLLTTC